MGPVERAGSDTAFRTDIQALRGLAVLLVVAYHARLPEVPSGFLGVDIFFVISGFLITTLVARGLRAGSFSFKRFYHHRARRLLPAAYLVFATCALVAPWQLTGTQEKEFWEQLLGAVTFTANFVLLGQTGYFAEEAAVKPLLHTWSLSIEEQYYLLLPLCLAILPRRHWWSATVLVTAASLVLCLWMTQEMPDAAFFLLPARAWELGLGSALALASPAMLAPLRRVAPLVPFLFIAILLVCFLPGPLSLPSGYAALVVCSATALIIAAPSPVLNEGRLVGLLARVGDMSYSLYLVHWPVLAFLTNAHTGNDELGWPVRAAGVGASFVVAYLLYSQVENRFRIRRNTKADFRQSLLWLLSPAVLLLILYPGLMAKVPTKTYSQELTANIGLDVRCDYGDAFKQWPQCQDAPAPGLLLWGDSFAMHLALGIAATTRDGVIQATRSTCAPILGVAYWKPPQFGKGWGAGCIAFNESVLDYLRDHPSVTTVVLASRNFLFGVDIFERGAAEGSAAEPGSGIARAAIIETVRQIRALGRRVVVVAPPPVAAFNIGRCIERKDRRIVTFGIEVECRIDAAAFRANSRPMTEFLGRLEKEADIPSFSFEDLLCSAEYCDTKWEDTILYRDGGHFTAEGSIAIAKRVNLGKTLAEIAR